MSRFFSGKYDTLTPYTPGEQPRGQTFLKLNTNESPFPPAPLAQQYAKGEIEKLQLYSDPQCRDLVAMAAEKLGVKENQIIFTNGSDDVLNFAFMAFCDAAHPAVFPDITYGFYSVFAQLNGVPYTEIPLQPDFTIRVEDYLGLNQTIFIANPNAPTGICLPLCDIARIVESNPDNVVVIDEAYIDFGGESALKLIDQYDNLLVVQTFSKSRSMAGARLGFAVGNDKLIQDLNTIRYSTNPYNINRMTMAAGVGALEADGYFAVNCRKIMEARDWTTKKLTELGFEVIPSMANFVFAKHPAFPGKDIYLALREKGVLVRHFDKPRLHDYNRITIGSREQMKAFIKAITEILEESQ